MTQPPVLISFTDGMTSTLDDGAAAFKGRTLDQIRVIEVHPSGGGVVSGRRHDGVDVVGINMVLDNLPFQVVMMVPTATGKIIGRQLTETASGLIVAQSIPPDLPSL